jgi:hypothetical protein
MPRGCSGWYLGPRDFERFNTLLSYAPQNDDAGECARHSLWLEFNHHTGPNGSEPKPDQT